MFIKFEKQKLEIVSKKNILNYQINELEEKIQSVDLNTESTQLLLLLYLQMLKMLWLM